MVPMTGDQADRGWKQYLLDLDFDFDSDFGTVAASDAKGRLHSTFFPD